MEGLKMRIGFETAGSRSVQQLNSSFCGSSQRKWRVETPNIHSAES